MRGKRAKEIRRKLREKMANEDWDMKLFKPYYHKAKENYNKHRD